MNMDFNLNLIQEQKLIMTQEMQLSIKLLQMSNFELQEYVDKQLQENPVLEETVKVTDKNNYENEVDKKAFDKYKEIDEYGYKDYGYRENINQDREEVSPFTFISNKKSLKDYLHDQIAEGSSSESLKTICEYMIECIDDRGYLVCSVEEISQQLKVDSSEVEEALEEIQSLEPSGVGCRDLKECLIIQLRNLGELDEELECMINNYLEYVADNKYNLIAKKMGISINLAQEYGDTIKKMEPKPSRGFYTGDDTKYIIPDAYIFEVDGEISISMNDEIIPGLKTNEMYNEIVKNTSEKEVLTYVKEKINEATFLMKSIEARKNTIQRVLEVIVKKQKDYFLHGEKYLKPMTLKEISEELEMHESTISRAVKDKYVNTKRGTLKLKKIFTTAISSNSTEDVSVTNIKRLIDEMVQKEDKTKPLSDQVICDKLNAAGMNISRRTVAKYREEIGIKSSSKRKRY